MNLVSVKHVGISGLSFLTVFVASLLGSPSAAAAATPQCNGLAATIVSSARVINGTSEDDVIVVSGFRSHVINSGAGNDVICGSVGNDRIDAGLGDDYVLSGAGKDTIRGGAGNDTISGGAGNDKISGGAGADSLSGGTGRDNLQGASGADQLSGGLGSDMLFGGAGNDSLQGDAGRDKLNGGAGTNYCATDSADLVTGSCSDGNLVPATPNPSDAPTEDFNSPTPNPSDAPVVSPPDLFAGPVIRHCAIDEADLLTPCTIDISDPGTGKSDAVSIVSAGAELTFMWSFDNGYATGPTGPTGANSTVTDPEGLTGASGAIKSSWVKIAGPSGWVTSWCGFAISGTQSLVTSQRTVYTAICQVPQDAVNADYVAYFEADRHTTTSLSAAFRVTGGSSDSSAPVVNQIGLSSPTLTYGQTLDIEFSAEDETGTQGIIAWAAFNGYGFADNQGRSFIDYKEYSTLTSGDEKSGSYRQQIALNSFAPIGEYTIWISSLDKLGNKVFYQTDVKFRVTE
jgi:hypothetical protein